MKLEDPTIPFAGVVAPRRHERAGADSAVFRLGAAGRDWEAIYSDPGSKVVLGASDVALGVGRVERTLQVLGALGGLLVDLGFQVCPASALTGRTLEASLVVWVSDTGSSDDERDQLAALPVPGVWIGAGAGALDGSSRIDADEFKDRNGFIRRFVAEVSALIDTTQ